MKTIYLTGYMGSGKTSTGKALAEELDLPVFDTDMEIINKTGMDINRIFSEKGEAYFRVLETEILKSLPVENAIITTGGGIILNLENRRWLSEKGWVIFLETEPEEILKRLNGDSTRPLLRGDKEKAVREGVSSRHDLYVDTADFSVKTDRKSINQVVDEIKACLKRFD